MKGSCLRCVTLTGNTCEDGTIYAEAEGSDQAYADVGTIGQAWTGPRRRACSLLADSAVAAQLSLGNSHVTCTRPSTLSFLFRKVDFASLRWPPLVLLHSRPSVHSVQSRRRRRHYLAFHHRYVLRPHSKPTHLQRESKQQSPQSLALAQQPN